MRCESGKSGGLSARELAEFGHECSQGDGGDGAASGDALDQGDAKAQARFCLSAGGDDFFGGDDLPVEAFDQAADVALVGTLAGGLEAAAVVGPVAHQIGAQANQLPQVLPGFRGRLSARCERRCKRSKITTLSLATSQPNTHKPAVALFLVGRYPP